MDNESTTNTATGSTGQASQNHVSRKPLSKKALATIQRRDEKLRPRRIAAARTDPRQLSIFGQSHTQDDPR